MDQFAAKAAADVVLASSARCVFTAVLDGLGARLDTQIAEAFPGSARFRDRRSTHRRPEDFAVVHGNAELVREPGNGLLAELSKYVDVKLVSGLKFGSGAVAMRYKPTK